MADNLHLQGFVVCLGASLISLTSPDLTASYPTYHDTQVCISHACLLQTYQKRYRCRQNSAKAGSLQQSRILTHAPMNAIDTLDFYSAYLRHRFLKYSKPPLDHWGLSWVLLREFRPTASIKRPPHLPRTWLAIVSSKRGIQVPDLGLPTIISPFVRHSRMHWRPFCSRTLAIVPRNDFFCATETFSPALTSASICTLRLHSSDGR